MVLLSRTIQAKYSILYSHKYAFYDVNSKGSLAASTWKQYVFQQLDFSSRGSSPSAMSCKAHCYFSSRPCTMFLADTTSRQCYLGNRDVLNELAVSFTDSLELFESKGI